MKIGPSAALALVVTMLSACGSSSTTTTISTTTVTASASSGPVGTSGPASTRQGASGPGAGVPRCRAAMLALAFLGQQGATGHGELGFALRNVSGSSCRTFGYPGVLFLSQDGRALPTITTRTTHDFFGTTPLSSVLLAPGKTASFRIGVTHGISSTAGCATAYGLQVIPPDDTATLRTNIGGGAFECRTATVSPLRAGTGAYP